MASKKYATARAFRRALEDRLQSISQRDHIDLQRLRREVAFDRMLARLFAGDPAPWVLKGGYLMELRLRVARSTRDVDLMLRGRASLIREDLKDRNQAVRELLEDSASTDLGDFFAYVIGEAMMDLNVPAYGGARFPVEARVDGRRFVNFHIDIAVIRFRKNLYRHQQPGQNPLRFWPRNARFQTVLTMLLRRSACSWIRSR